MVDIGVFFERRKVTWQLNMVNVRAGHVRRCEERNFVFLFFSFFYFFSLFFSAFVLFADADNAIPDLRLSLKLFLGQSGN